MAKNDDLSKRIDELEKAIFERLDRLEHIVLKDQPAEISPAPENSIAINDVEIEAAGIEAEARAKLASIAAANNAIGSEEQANVSTVETVGIATERPKAQPAAPKETPQWIQNFTDIEWLTSRIGISLLLIGIITSFFWLNNQEWVTDGMRLGTGYGISGILLGLGLRLSRNRPSFGQLLAGGGIASAYITTFIGHFLLDAIPDIPTIIIVFAITMLTYGIAVWQKQQSLAYVGLIFGLLTPPIVNPADPSIPAFVTYICLIVLGPIAIYYSLRWIYLMFVAAAFSWIYMVSLTGSEVFDSITPLASNQFAIQGGILFCLIGFGIVPLIREWKDRSELNVADMLAFEAARDESQPERATVENESEEKPADTKTRVNPFMPHWTIYPYITASPILAAGISLMLWPEISAAVWATLMVVAAIAYFAAGFWMGQDKRYEVFQLPLFISGAVLLLLAPFKATNNLAAILLILFSVEAVGFALFSQRQKKPLVMLLPHLLFVGALFTWLGGILPETIENPFFNLNFFASLLFVGSLIATAWAQEMGVVKIIYQFVAHLIALPITGLEIAEISTGETYWLLFHTLIHIGVFAAGLFTENKTLRYQGIIFAGVAMLVQAALDADSSLTWPDLMLFIAALQIVGICASGKLWEDELVSMGGYIVSGVGMLALLARFVSADVSVPFVGLSSLSTLSMLIALLVVSLWYSDKTISMVIGIAAHLLALTWLVVQCQDFANAQGIITALWAVYAIVLLIAGLLFDKKVMRNLGIGTILLTVAKLLLFDLENVSTGGRVLLFSGFGVVLLVISYFTRTLWRQAPDEEAGEEIEEIVSGE